MSGPGVLSSLFQASLSRTTSLYIESKALLTSGSPDLRLMRSAVKEDLALLQQEAGEDYLKAAEDIELLGAELHQADSILEQIEQVLVGFKDKLCIIKSDMTTLQERSTKINSALSNKKEVSQALSSFIDSAILEPGLAKAICAAEIDLQYGDQLQTLSRKINHLRSNPTQSKAARQIQPQLEKLSTRASQRLKEHIGEKLSALRKVKERLHEFKRDQLLPTRPFLHFLKDHNLQIFTELCNSYRDTACKYYSAQFKTYFSECFKLQMNYYVKSDSLLFDQGAIDKRLSALKVARPGLKLGTRESVLEERKEEVIECHLASQKGLKFLPEAIFKSCNRVILETIISEMEFLGEWIGLKNQESWELFGAVFRPSLNLLSECMRNSLEANYDPYSVLLILLITRRGRALLDHKHLRAANFFYQQLDMVYWPKFEQLFDQQLKSLQGAKTVKANQRTQVVERFLELFQSYYSLYARFEESKMLTVRLEKLRVTFFEFVAKNLVEENTLVAGYTNLRIVEALSRTIARISKLKQQKQLIQLLALLQKEQAKYTELLANSYLAEQYGELVRFSKSNSADLETQNKAAKPVDIRLLEPLCEHFMKNWVPCANTFRAECEKQLGLQSAEQLKTRYLSSVTGLYNGLYRYTKNNYPSLTAGLLQAHVLIKELKKKLGKSE